MRATQAIEILLAIGCVIQFQTKRAAFPEGRDLGVCDRNNVIDIVKVFPNEYWQLTSSCRYVKAVEFRI